MMLEDIVDLLGYELAGVVGNVPDAIRKVEEAQIDLAVLDIHLRGEECWPVADRLADRGIPFVLASGGSLAPPPARHAGAASVSKPFALDSLEKVLGGILSAQRGAHT